MESVIYIYPDCQFQKVSCVYVQYGLLFAKNTVVMFPPLECPRNMDVVKDRGTNRRISWSHSLPKESQFYNDIEYTVVEVNSNSREETLLDGESQEHGY